jgi:Domain of unknown function (DUF4922)
VIEHVEELLRRQREAWPLLAAGVAGLRAADTRRVEAGGRGVLVRHVPHRVASTTAAVDAASVARRPCFLCAANMPPEEEGLAFSPDFKIYANPFPVVQKHLTVVHREHRPQRIHEALGPMLDLAEALPGFFAVYNGPECGASAPDHQHLQAGALDELPIAASMRQERVTAAVWRALLFRGERACVESRVRRAIDVLADLVGRERAEPLLNAAAFGEATDLSVLLFPRSKHRPAAFHTGELRVSPAALDMCGVLVAPFADDFARLDGDSVDALFREVSVSDALLQTVAARLERA